MPKFISDEDMEKLSPSKPVISDDDMAAMEMAENRPGLLSKISSIPGNVYQAGKTLITHGPSDIGLAVQNPGEAADVSLRGLAKGASFLSIPDQLKLEAEKTIARNLPESLGGLSDEEYKNLYERGDDQALIAANREREQSLDAKYPALALGSEGAGFAFGNNPASMIAKVGTQSTSNALNQGLPLNQALKEGGEDALIAGGLTYGTAPAVRSAKGLLNAPNALSESLGSKAETLAENATGATGLQRSKFRPGTGRELLDRGIVKFFDNPEDIADRAAMAQEAAGNTINDVLQKLDAKGVTASLPSVIDALQDKVAELKKIPGNDAIISRINNEIDNLSSRVGLEQGPPTISRAEIPISEGEIAKRNFQDQVNYFSPQADQKAAYHAASAFKNEVENAAEQASPDLANQFKAAKQTYGLLAPVQEAAEKRANQLNQHPLGGLGDLGAAAIGHMGNAPMAVGVAAKRALFPRLSSSMAVTADKLSQMLKTEPGRLGKYAQPLMDAAARGGNALGVTNYILQSVDPEFQRLMHENDDDSGAHDVRQ